MQIESENLLTNNFISALITSSAPKKHIYELTKMNTVTLYMNKLLNCGKRIVQSNILSVLLKSLHAVRASLLEKALEHNITTKLRKLGWESLSLRREQHIMILIYKALLANLLRTSHVFLIIGRLHTFTRARDYLVVKEHLK